MSQNKGKPTLSHSRVDSYQTCGYAYYRAYIMGDYKPPGIFMLRGSGMHKAAEVNFNQKIETHKDLPLDDIIEIAVTGFEQRMVEDGLSMTPAEQKRGHKVVVSEAKDSTAVHARIFGEKQAPDYQPVWVEEKYRIELPESSHDLTGVIDIFDDQYRVMDFKTSGRKKRQADVDTSFQLQCYSLAVYKRTGAVPAEAGLDVSIHRDSGSTDRQVLTTQHTVEDLEVMVNRINAVLHGINSGVFPPAKAGSWKCTARYCGYAADQSCPYYNPARDPESERFSV